MNAPKRRPGHSAGSHAHDRPADDELLQAILAAAPEVDGRRRLACGRALALANEHGVPPARIGKCCEQIGVKITACQLGCF